MKEINPCPLCKTKCEIYGIPPLNQLFTISCPSCGKYNLTDVAIHVLDKRKDSFHIISGITRNFYELHKDTDGLFVIKGEMIDDDAKFQAEFISKAPKSVPEKTLLLLQYICRKSNYPGAKVLVNSSQDYPIYFCKNAKELIFYINHIRDSGYIKADGTMRDYTLSLTIKGWQKVENLQQTGEIHDSSNGGNTSMEWDVFICHASEDKEEFVRPLAISLISHDLKVWYDEFTLTVGDSLRRSINKGLANSRYGIVVISPNFLHKDWPQKELDGLDALEVNGRKVILPVWHQIDAIGVRKYSPILADRVATTSQKGLEQVIIDICEAMERPLTKGKRISLTHKFPDQHHQHNFVSASVKKFKKVKNMMPKLITEFKTDLSTEDNKLIREFFVLPNKKVLLGGSEKPRLVYYEEEHKGLRNKIDILENQGFLIDVTPGNAPIYRMTEEFVELIIKYG